MSVTLKLADEDAAVIGSILRAVAQPLQGFDRGESLRQWFTSVQTACGNRTPERISELAGAFKVAVRANER